MTTKSVLSVADIRADADLSIPTIYSEINSGRLRSFKVGRRRLVRREAYEEWKRQREEETAPAPGEVA